MNKHTASGKIDQIKGKVKQGVGEATGNDRMANSGAMDQVKGNAKEAWGNTKDAARSTSADAHDDSRARADAHDMRNKVTSMAKDAKDSISEKADDFKRRRSA
jgi:uncharacterized protein YjbJ (UPF0337 family)